MSLTAKERSNPPPRRKSCAACVKAKRRCDGAVPACLRCSQRRIACQYQNRGRRSQAPAPRPELETWASDERPSAPLATQLGTPPDDFNTGIPDFDTGLFDLAGFELPMDDPLLELVPQPSMLTPPAYKDFEAVSAAITNRLQWSVDQIRKAPASMVLESQTPWSHPLLWRDDMPRSMQDAHASCALYMAKNRVNAPIILRSIEAKVQDLLASPPPQTLRDCLAHTQALILYEIMRLLDGDMMTRAAGERTLSALETSALALLGHVSFDMANPAACPLPLFPLGPTSAFWRDWIMQESARRSLLFTFYFAQAYRILAGHPHPQCDGRLGLCHSWTFSAHLWRAGSAVAFAEAWGGKKHFIVTDARFNSVLEEAAADDVDEFGKIFLSSLLGVDEAEGWFAAKGGKL